jgi:zinc resistance-associated protein
MSKTMTIITVLALTLVAASAFAYRGGYGGGPLGLGCPGYNANGYAGGAADLTQEQQADLEQAYADFNASMEPLREAMWAKRTELDALVESGSADSARIQTLIAEMSDLRARMRAERDAFQSTLVSEYGITARGGYGMGRGGRGMGRGFGGRGGCWR